MARAGGAPENLTRAGKGRKKGSKNRIPAEARSMFKLFVDRRSAEIDALWNDVAYGKQTLIKGRRGQRSYYMRVGADPAKALALIGQLAEYVLPKLQRTELTGLDGGPVQYEEAEARRQNLDAINRLSQRLPGAAPGEAAPTGSSEDPAETDPGTGS